MNSNMNEGKIPDAIPYNGSEEGIAAIIISDQGLALPKRVLPPAEVKEEHKPLSVQDEKTEQPILETPPKRNKTKKSNLAAILLTAGLVIASGVAIFIWQKHDKEIKAINSEKERVEDIIKQVNENISLTNYEIALSMLDGIDWRLSPEDNGQLVEQYKNQKESLRQTIIPLKLQQDSLKLVAIQTENFELPPPGGFTFVKEVEMDWRDGELIVPPGMFWEIQMMYKYDQESSVGKAVASKLCHRQRKLKKTSGYINSKGYYQEEVGFFNVFLTINNVDYFLDDLRITYPEMINKFKIRRFGLPAGTSICFPSSTNGGPSEYFTFFVNEYATSEFIALSAIDNLVYPDSIIGIKTTDSYTYYSSKSFIEIKSFFVDILSKESLGDENFCSFFDGKEPCFAIVVKKEVDKYKISYSWECD